MKVVDNKSIYKISESIVSLCKLALDKSVEIGVVQGLFRSYPLQRVIDQHFFQQVYSLAGNLCAKGLKGVLAPLRKSRLEIF